MKELIRSNDLVLLSWLSALLADAGIEAVVLDGYTSVVEGSLGILPRRLMVAEEDHKAAHALLVETRTSAARMITVTEDRLLDGRVRLRQPRQGYRAAIDPVLLAAASPAGNGDRVLDIGTGVGAAALCLAARIPGVELVGLELQPELAALAGENARLNKSSLVAVAGDVRRPPFAPACFNHVIANPPFLGPGSFTPSENASAMRANAESEASLRDWIGFARAMLRPRGSLTLIHRADRLDDVMAALHGRFGAIVLAPLWPAAGRDAKRILVLARKGSRAPARLTAGLVPHREDGQFTTDADAVLRGAQPLSFLPA